MPADPATSGMTNPAGDIPSASEASPKPASLIDDVKILGRELLGLLHDRLELAALETKFAAQNLVGMIATGVVVAVLLVSAWLCLLGAMVLWLIHVGLMASVAMLLGVLVNLALAALLYRSILRQSHHLGWPATLRSLKQFDTTEKGDHGRQ
ncbi:phage holin family protein [Sulfuriferula multivorans]|nr:phage holin family protein [Sulfuriferula multivorans]